MDFFLTYILTWQFLALGIASLFLIWFTIYDKRITFVFCTRMRILRNSITDHDRLPTYDEMMSIKQWLIWDYDKWLEENKNENKG